MSLHIACYDVADDRRRARVARLLLRHGVRVQKSVFEVWLEPEQVPGLQREVGRLLGRDDAFDLYPFDSRAGRMRMRWQRAPEAWPAVVGL